MQKTMIMIVVTNQQKRNEEVEKTGLTSVNDNNDNDNINNDEESDDYDCSHKLAKQEQRSGENRSDGLRLSSNVSLSLIPFLI